MKFNELRKSAESRLADTAPSFALPLPDDRSLLLHDLGIHQIELESQNEELRKTHDALISSRDRYADLYNSTPVALLTLSNEGLILEANNTSVDMLATSRTRLIEHPLSDYVSYHDQDALYHFYQHLHATKKTQAIDILMHNPEGRQFWIRLEGSVIVDELEHVNQIRASLINITSSKLIQEQLSAQKNLLDLILRTTKDMIALKDNRHVYQLVNPAFCQFIGKPEEDIVGKTDYELFDEKTAALFQQDDALVMTTGNASIRDEQFLSSDTEHWLHVIKSPMTNESMMPGVLCSIRDITQRKSYEHSIWRQANFDELTGLPNRSLFMDRCEQAIHSAHRDNTRIALFFIDLDRFKWVNDTLGHEAGDNVLQETAKRLMSCSRETDTVARLSGDEFTLILPNVTDVNDISVFAEKILSTLAQPHHLQGSEDCYISGSIGITFYPDDGTDLKTMLRNADRAMYRAKGRGRNAIEFFTPKLNECAHQRMNLIEDLRNAVENKELVILYQPIIDLKTNTIFGAEALLRWQHPHRGLLLPENFIVTAEESGAIITIGKWVLNQVSQQTTRWKTNGMDLSYLSVNVSFRQFKNKNFLQELRSILAQNNLPSCDLNLNLEITESLMLSHTKENIELLNNIKQMNISLSLDDFGTGYSSIQQLKHFPIDTLKIDRSYVHSIMSNKKDAMLTQSIISMAQNLGMRVIAEGIETEEQLDFLRASGVDYGQGYYFSRPLSDINFSSYYETHCLLTDL